MDEKDLHEKLDELISRPQIHRKVSIDKTDECPIWDPYEQLWKESDAKLRELLK